MIIKMFKFIEIVFTIILFLLFLLFCIFEIHAAPILIWIITPNDNLFIISLKLIFHILWIRTFSKTYTLTYNTNKIISNNEKDEE